PTCSNSAATWSVLCLRATSSCTSSGSPTMSPAVIRGLSDEYGSWKIICIPRRCGRNSALLRRVMSRPPSLMVPLVGSSSRSTVRATVDLPQRFAFADFEADAIDRVDLPDGATDDSSLDGKMLFEVGDLEHGGTHGAAPTSRSECQQAAQCLGRFCSSGG